MNFNLKSFVLVSVAAVALMGNTATAATLGTNVILTPAVTNTDMTHVETRVAALDVCPSLASLITLNDDDKGNTTLRNVHCFGVGARCDYGKDFKQYAQCNCAGPQSRASNPVWQCFLTLDNPINWNETNNENGSGN